MNANDLRNGARVFFWDGDAECFECATAERNMVFGVDTFTLEFRARIVKSSKRFDSFKKQVEKFCADKGMREMTESEMSDWELN